MDFAPTAAATAATRPQPAADAAGAQAGRNALVSSDFQTFLRMLTTQLQNQDPLNPMESTDFAVQLATFSGVEQQVRSNELLEGLGAQIGALGMAQLSGWLGMEARTPAPVAFDGNPVALSPTASPLADRAVLVARNALGAEVHRQDLPLPPRPLDWAGFDAAGRLLSPGRYSFEVESYSGEGLIAVDPVETFSRVTEARLEGGEILLVLDGGAEVPAAAITGLRAASDPAAPPPR